MHMTWLSKCFPAYIAIVGSFPAMRFHVLFQGRFVKRGIVTLVADPSLNSCVFKQVLFQTVWSWCGKITLVAFVQLLSSPRGFKCKIARQLIHDTMRPLYTVWVSWWLFRLLFWVNDLSHMTHLCGFSPLWVSMCCLRGPDLTLL